MCRLERRTRRAGGGCQGGQDRGGSSGVGSTHPRGGRHAGRRGPGHGVVPGRRRRPSRARRSRRSRRVGTGAGRDRSREAAIQPRPAARRARARAHEVRRRRSGPAAAESRRRPTCGEPPPSWRRPSRASSARPSCTSVNSSRSRRSTTPRRRCGSSGAAYDAALQEARNLQADIDASAAAMKLAERQLRDASHPRAVRRLRPASGWSRSASW